MNLSEINPIQLKLAQLQEELRKFQNQNSHNWRIYVVAICYAVIAWMQSEQALILYLGTLVLIFMVHERSERRNKQQMKLIAELIEELQKQKS